MTIYLDAVWTLNFFLDMMLLMLTKALAKDNTSKVRIVFGAFIASLLVPISLYFPNTFITSIVGKLIFSVLIILCSFQFLSIFRMIKLLLLFYFTTFTIGGGLIALHFLFQDPISLTTTGLLTFDGGYGDPISWLFVLIGFPIVWLFTKSRMDKHAIEKIRYDQLCPVSIQLKGKLFSTSGYIDSGNQLVDPLTKLPVIVCDEIFLKQWFTDMEWKKLEEAYEHLRFDDIPEKWEKKLHVVPYQGVDGKSNFIFSIRPDRIIITYNGKKITTSKVLVGIQFSTLTKDQTYHCLLQPQLIKLASVYSA